MTSWCCSAPTGQVDRGVEVAISRYTRTLQVNTRWPSVRSGPTVPQWEHTLTGRIPAVSHYERAAAPGLLVGQDGGRTRSSRHRRSLRARWWLVQHPGHVEVFEDEPVVGLDQHVGDLVQEMPPHVRDAMMVAAQLRDGVAAVVGSVLYCGTTTSASRRCVLHAGRPTLWAHRSIRATSVPSARAATSERRQTPIHADPATRIAGARRVAVGGVQIGGLDSSATPTTARPRWLTVANRILARPLASIRRNRRVSSRTAIGPMPGRVTERGRRGRRPGSLGLPALGVLVAQPKRRRARRSSS